MSINAADAIPVLDANENDRVITVARHLCDLDRAWFDRYVQAGRLLDGPAFRQAEAVREAIADAVTALATVYGEQWGWSMKRDEFSRLEIDASDIPF